MIDILLQSIGGPKNKRLWKFKRKEKIQRRFHSLILYPKHLRTTFSLTQLIGYERQSIRRYKFLSKIILTVRDSSGTTPKLFWGYFIIKNQGLKMCVSVGIRVREWVGVCGHTRAWVSVCVCVRARVRVRTCGREGACASVRACVHACLRTQGWAYMCVCVI